MEAIFKESRPIFPRRLWAMLAAVLLSTAAFIAVTSAVMDTGMPSWAPPAIAAAFVIVILATALPRLEVECLEDRVRVRYAVRRIEIPFDQIIDKRRGEIGEIRNYGSWNLKGVKHISCLAVGDDLGVAMKLAGKRVVVVSCEDPEALYGALPSRSEE